MTVTCPNCKGEIDSGVNFCPHRGYKIGLKNQPLSSGQKIKIYLISFVLSPLGLFWFFKYFTDEKQENKRVAYISLILTLIPLIFMLISGRKIMDSLSGSIQNELDVYSEFGL